ncbi:MULTISPECIES: ParB/RepB/Spo0J family partition protein [Rhizobiaceae]|uniref:Chromosome partitioning protein, ParB family n=1 Tax=Xaviernesmea oryzae TaxID=464029 RepID=A0A1X7E2E0_9HYPH|nr:MULTISPECIES: ParB/RepB/Spo0J family partition protein [Rhizobiaceae]SMF25822.1 chromosome partitioning protein, ParB family [Xaviernesmea oryzae]
MTTIIIELNKLDADPKNVRKRYDPVKLRELAANIGAEGVLQNLVVRAGDKRGRYFVTAGERRRLALLLLVEQGKIAKNHPVECKLREAANATEISLSENVFREDMHPVDQYEAFSTMAAEGKSITDIAAHFSVTEIIVRRRLALAKVSPKLLELHRDGEMTFEQLSAFTVCDDHERQEQVWGSLSQWDRRARQIKSALMTEEVPSTDRRVMLIGGLDVYEQAGGAVRRDLFDEEGGGYALDVALLDRLASEKLEDAAAPYRGAGWKWVETAFERPDWIFNFPRIYPTEVELSAEDQAEHDSLSQEHDDLTELIDGEDDEDGDDESIEAAVQRLAEIDKRLDELSAKQETYLPEDMARGGVVVFINRFGNAEAAVGIIREEDEVEEPDDDDSDEAVAEDGEAGPETVNASGKSSATEERISNFTHPQSLIEVLTAKKTAALRVELANNPGVALAAVVHAMLLRISYGGYVSEQSALQVSLIHERTGKWIKEPEDCAASVAFESLQENYGHKIPGNPADLFDWCLEQDRDELLSLLAYAAAHAVNAVEVKFSDRRSGIEQANQLGRALKVDMTNWFETTADSYFSHVNRRGIEQAVLEARGPEAALAVSAASKKAEAVLIAERKVKGSGWLPAPVRIAADPNAEVDADAQPLPMAAE